MEKRGPRRGAKRGHAFKESKAVIGTEYRTRSQKPKKNDPHVTVESAEFQLLVKLYVPTQLLITNNKVSLKQLKECLPVLVNADYPDLNLELHLFLSSIVTSYVSSWYLSKLNTDNTDFVAQVYMALSDLVQDFAARVSAVAESPRLLELVNELVDILERHISDNQLVDGVRRYAAELSLRGKNNISVESDLGAYKQRYLAESHVIFSGKTQSKQPGDKKDTNDDKKDTNDETADDSSSRIFYRTIASEVLAATFSPSHTSQGSRDSKIISNLLTIIVGDLVFGRIIGLLSSPKFILNDLLTTAFVKMGKAEPSERDKASRESPSMAKRIIIAWKTARQIFQTPPSKSSSRPSILHSPVLRLMDTLTRFSQVRSLLAQCLSLVRACIYLNGELAQKIEDFFVASIMTKIRLSVVLDDSFLATTVGKLRLMVFDKTPKRPASPTPELTTEELSDLIYSTMAAKCSKSRVLDTVVRSLAYKGQGAGETKEEIEQLIEIFDCRDMNKLLIAKLFDSVVCQLYPSMVCDV